MDNRQFNVNGSDKEYLVQTLSLALMQDRFHTSVKGFQFMPEKGLMLSWYVPDPRLATKVRELPVPISNPNTLADIVWDWLKSDEAKLCLDHLDSNKWDVDLDHDGHNTVGWRVYCEDWGQVVNSDTFIAIKPVFLWHGK